MANPYLAHYEPIWIVTADLSRDARETSGMPHSSYPPCGLPSMKDAHHQRIPKALVALFVAGCLVAIFLSRPRCSALFQTSETMVPRPMGNALGPDSEQSDASRRLTLQSHHEVPPESTSSVGARTHRKPEPTDQIPAGAMKVHGIVTLDPDMLKGRRAAVIGCGRVSPIHPDLTYDLTVDVVGCCLSVVVADPSGSIAIGTGTIVGYEGPVAKRGSTSREANLVGPVEDDFDPLELVVSRTQNSLDAMESACQSGELPSDCEETMVAALREDQAWLEEQLPVLQAWAAVSTDTG